MKLGVTALNTHDPTDWMQPGTGNLYAEFLFLWARRLANRAHGDRPKSVLVTRTLVRGCIWRNRMSIRAHQPFGCMPSLMP